MEIGRIRKGLLKAAMDGKVLPNAVELKTLNELFQSPYRSENCRAA